MLMPTIKGGPFVSVWVTIRTEVSFRLANPRADRPQLAESGPQNQAIFGDLNVRYWEKRTFEQVAIETWP